MAKANRHQPTTILNGVALNQARVILPSVDASQKFLAKMNNALEHQQTLGKAITYFDDENTPKRSCASIFRAVKSILAQTDKFAQERNADKYVSGLTMQKANLRQVLQFAEFALNGLEQTLLKKEFPEIEVQNETINEEDLRAFYKQAEKMQPQTDIELSDKEKTFLRCLRISLEKIIQQEDKIQNNLEAASNKPVNMNKAVNMNASNLARTREWSGVFDSKMGFSAEIIADLKENVALADSQSESGMATEDIAAFSMNNEIEPKVNDIKEEPLMAEIYVQAIKVNNRLAGVKRPAKSKENTGQELSEAEKFQKMVDFYAEYGVNVVAIPINPDYEKLDNMAKRIEKLEDNLDITRPIALSDAAKAFNEFKNSPMGEAEQKAYQEKIAVLQEELTQEKQRQEAQLDADNGRLRKAQQRREIFWAATCVADAVWNGFIEQPRKYSPWLKEHVEQRTASLSSAGSQANLQSYQAEDYNLKKSLIWQVCAESKAFRKHEKDVINGLRSLNIPPEMVKHLGYGDIAYLINLQAKNVKSNIAKKIVRHKNVVNGVQISPSAREIACERLVKEHKNEIWRIMQNQGKSTEEIQQSIDSIRMGKIPAGTGLHHRFEKSDIKTYLEVVRGVQGIDECDGMELIKKMTRRNSYLGVNDEVIYMRDDCHFAIEHTHENYVDKDGYSTFNFKSVQLNVHNDEELEEAANQRKGGQLSHRTIYTDENGQMFYLSLITQNSVDIVLGPEDYGFNAKKLSENIKNDEAQIALVRNVEEATLNTEGFAGLRRMSQQLITAPILTSGLTDLTPDHIQMLGQGEQQTGQQAQFISITGQKIDGQLKTAEITEDLSQKETQRQIDIHSGKVRTHVEQEKNGEAQKSAQSQDKQEQRGKFAPRIGNLQQRRDFSQNNGRFNGRKGKIAYGG